MSMRIIFFYQRDVHNVKYKLYKSELSNKLRFDNINLYLGILSFLYAKSLQTLIMDNGNY